MPRAQSEKLQAIARYAPRESHVNYPANLRAITIANPWAWDIITGVKGTEFRSWDTQWQGLCLIHVSSDRSYESEFTPDDGLGLQQIRAMRQSIIGFAFRVGSEQQEDGSYGHWMEGTARFAEPIPCPGALNYWRPQSNRPRQAQAFQETWELIRTHKYTAIDQYITDNYLEKFDLPVEPRRILITPAPVAEPEHRSDRLVPIT